MQQNIKIFGAALDALSSPEKVNLKLAYINHLMEESLSKEGFRDPYDFIRAYIKKRSAPRNKMKWAGEIPIPSWLRPKPKVSDYLTLSVDKIERFLRRNGCWEYALVVADYLNKKIYPAFPMMIGVDHSLTGGSVMALAKRYPNLNIVILDAHFDVMKMRHETYGLSGNMPGKIICNEPLNYYGCGNFLEHLLAKRIIMPWNLWILGVQDEVCQELKEADDSRREVDSNMLSIKKWIEKGVHVIFKHEVHSDLKLDLTGPTYVSIDMDVGSLSSIYSARFMNSYGLDTEEMLRLLHLVHKSIDSSHFALVGLDIMELDIHFFEIGRVAGVDDRTGEIIEEIFELFVNNGDSNYAS
jgi:arginase family enzyme